MDYDLYRKGGWKVDNFISHLSSTYTYMYMLILKLYYWYVCFPMQYFAGAVITGSQSNITCGMCFNYTLTVVCEG